MRSLYRRLIMHSFWYVSPLYRKIYAKQLKKPIVEYDSGDILRSDPSTENLSREFTYFVLHASYGDKWCILSFLGYHLSRYPKSIVIADRNDRPLISIFLGEFVACERFCYVSSESLANISSLFRPVSKVSSQIVDSFSVPGSGLLITPALLRAGLPVGEIRHLHCVYYPYFNELLHLHAISYGKLIRTLLYIPANTIPIAPSFYSASDYEQAASLVQFNGAGDRGELRKVMFNVVNFSHAPLALGQIKHIIDLFIRSRFAVLINIAQIGQYQDLREVFSPYDCVKLVEIPPTLLALVSTRVAAVVGVLGGAMNVAVQFSSAHVLSMQTNANFAGCDDGEYLGVWGKENLWKWIDQDWPCLSSDRVVINSFIGDPETLSDPQLEQIIRDFIDQLPVAS